jgi:type IV pilus assembly protein PilC
MAKTKKITNRMVLEIYSGLVRLLESGLKPIEALRKLGLEDETLDPVFAKASEAMEQGDSLAQALVKGSDDGFPERDIAMLEAAEITGTYSETLQRLMNDHRRRAAVMKRFLARSLYPTLLVHFAAVVCIVSMSVSGATTFGLAALALALVPFYAIALFLGHLYKHYWVGPESRDRLQAYPFLMRIINESELGNFFRHLYTLYGAGIRLDDAAKRAAALIRTPSVRDRVTRALEPLGKREPFTNCLKGFGLPDDTYVTRLRIGEEAGQLEEALKETGEELAERAQKKAAALLGRAAVLVTILAYVGVTLIILGYYINHYSQMM